jgi:hypothetical protein
MAYPSNDPYAGLLAGLTQARPMGSGPMAPGELPPRPMGSGPMRAGEMSPPQGGLLNGLDLAFLQRLLAGGGQPGAPERPPGSGPVLGREMRR